MNESSVALTDVRTLSTEMNSAVPKTSTISVCASRPLWRRVLRIASRTGRSMRRMRCKRVEQPLDQAATVGRAADAHIVQRLVRGDAGAAEHRSQPGEERQEQPHGGLSEQQM